MIYGSVCSGIEAATVAWHPLGWRSAFFSEIEAFPRSVLKHHYPDVPLHGDFTTIGDDEYEPIDLLVGGTPCQSFSVAGLRKGLDDDRGNLALEFLRLADRTRPRWMVWENVPGVLSSSGGRDFGAFLGGLGELGYGWAYRVLDAQYVRVQSHSRAVPQRRRRVFVVGYLGDWRRAAAVLFEREGLQGHPAPRREAGQGVGPTLAARTRGGGGLGTDAECDGGLIAAEVASVLETMCHDYSRADGFNMVAHTLRGEGFDASEDGTGRANLLPVINARQNPVTYDGIIGPLDQDGGAHAVVIQEQSVSENVDAGPGGKGWRDDGAAYTLEARTTTQAVAFDPNQVTSKANRSVPRADVLHTLPAATTPPHLASEYAVRRLTPGECERLQGFPGGYTLVLHRGKPAADGPRYKALGNSMAVNVMRWIGERIAMMNEI